MKLIAKQKKSYVNKYRKIPAVNFNFVVNL